MVANRVISWILSTTKMKPKGVKSVMLPLTVCGWIVGMGVIEIPLGNRWPIMSFFYALVHVLSFGFVVKVTMDDLDDIMKYKSASAGWFIFKALFYGNVWLNISGTVMGWIRMKKVSKIVHRLECSNKKMEEIGITIDYRVIYLQQLIVLILQILYVFIFVFFTFYHTGKKFESIWRNLAFLVASYYPVILTTIGDLSFITLVRYV